MSLEHPIKVLFVCSLNRFRSYTAEKLYEGFEGYQVRSRGTEKGARIKLTAGDVGWADIIFAMEKYHANRIREWFGDRLVGKQIVILFIEDLYQPMDPALIEELKGKLGAYIDVPGEES